MAKKVDVKSALLKEVKRANGPEAVGEAEPSCMAFQKYRAAVHDVPTSQQAAAGLCRYLCAVELVQKGPLETSSLDVELLWVNGFNSDESAVTGDLALDRVATAYNLGVCLARMAQAKNTTGMGDAFKDAAQLFRESAGWFQLASELPTPSVDTSELGNDALQAISYAMLGNAHQMLYKHVSALSGFQDGTVATFAGGARDLYGSAAELGRVAGGDVDRIVGESARALQTHFKMVAMARQAAQYHKDLNVSGELKQLELAEAAAEDALQHAQALPKTGVLAWMGRLRTDLAAEAKNAGKDLKKRHDDAAEQNRKMMFLPAAPSVPDVAGRRLWGATDVRVKVAAEAAAVEKALAGLWRGSSS